MSKKTSFDMIAIKERLDEAKYEEDKAKGFKVTLGEKITHIIVALIACTILISFTFSYTLAPLLHFIIIALLLCGLSWRIYVVLHMDTRRH
ncbi:hypothetical protein [Fusibacter ferrireducens]|uniref:Uncharacterized protein n=1 Tax=Fusibacter ferrireducens TaxID=2785058 RepID=A0ABR9ZS92_9FIRM|nr:hypothetical protein [Fusibacter ferrireducens]MBF4692775.1 hypothetical protein [Fusibacter ferrireducens]